MWPVGIIGMWGRVLELLCGILTLEEFNENKYFFFKVSLMQDNKLCFKLIYILYDFDYQLWRLNPIFCLTTVT